MIFQNKSLDPNDSNVVTEIIKRFETWFGKPKVQQADEACRKFLATKIEPSETVAEFIIKYEAAEAELKCSAVELPKLIVSLHRYNEQCFVSEVP